MSRKLSEVSLRFLYGSTTMGLRQLLHNSLTPRSYRCHAYAELLRRRHASRSKRHGG
jgi:hypothetical protein